MDDHNISWFDLDIVFGILAFQKGIIIEFESLIFFPATSLPFLSRYHFVFLTNDCYLRICPIGKPAGLGYGFHHRYREVEMEHSGAFTCPIIVYCLLLLCTREVMRFGFPKTVLYNFLR